jgi:ABC-2 type transport system ATP-binding protein
MVGRLYHLPRAVVRARADELLERLDLADAADRLVRTFSGGMRRRLDLAASLVAAPPVLFLDEPTTGLDPRSRIELWSLLGELVRGGATLLLTTQYLEEADRLADDVVVLDGGRIAAQGSPAELKARIGGERLEVTVGGADELARAAMALGAFASDPPVVDAEASRVVAPVNAGVPLAEVVRALDAAGVATTDLHRREATLDDVFLALTEPTEKTMEVAA